LYFRAGNSEGAVTCCLELAALLPLDGQVWAPDLPPSVCSRFYKWRAKYGGMHATDAKRLRELEAENVKLKRPAGRAHLDRVRREQRATHGGLTRGASPSGSHPAPSAHAEGNKSPQSVPPSYASHLVGSPQRPLA